MYIVQIKTLKGDKTFIERCDTITDVRNLQHKTTSEGYTTPDNVYYKPYSVYCVCPQLIR